ncbi:MULTISPECIES: putative phage abortive infection protein [Enterobacter cloacae complex]|uniref:putative phage abortive infection protein n=1 Tax=Enterobacter cloacae complex TaxID=354276 RepID=UPI0007352035|nr:MULTISPECIES: putative phage abortive infection protein [Enterobacter cloacae complex]KTI49846.1 hypothetical protein ASV05_00930 [Enterobacter hormaechei subsp. xiangfangensis]MCG0494156.1 putative phage abortive infection protein [Enterobacter hormaechei]MCG0534808.1 putative phage abortive infection protein [Enterobacter hormaechei]MCG0549038.1 putative phage abortive infection protein [Enterobacter hormaechei]MCG0553595.1 putative phage abortive infection protein [Enterobacter hormaeche
MLIFFTAIIDAIHIFWTWFKTNSAPIGGLATALAFLATAWAAHEGRKSAKAAFCALKTSEDALDETRKNYRSDAFNQRFSLLLAQHNNYLEKVNEFARSESGWGLIKKTFESDKHFESFSDMSGHIILSPYMRILYHTLKFIDEDYFGSKKDITGRKKYTSLIRSLISNDILFLIAVNSSYIFRNGTKNQYYRYQFLLKQFDFFEHADFFSIYHQNDLTKKNVMENPFLRIEEAAGSCFYRCTKEGGYNSITEFEPTIRMPTIVAYIYKNPHQSFVINWFNASPVFLLNKFTEKTDKRSYKEIFNYYFASSYLGCYIDNKMPSLNSPFDEAGKQTLTPEILKSIIRAVRKGRLIHSDADYLRLIRLMKDNNFVLFHNKFESLYYRIEEYNNTIARKNDILFRDRFEPVKLMARKICIYEKNLRKQCVK